MSRKRARSASPVLESLLSITGKASVIYDGEVSVQGDDFDRYDCRHHLDSREEAQVQDPNLEPKSREMMAELDRERYLDLDLGDNIEGESRSTWDGSGVHRTHPETPAAEEENRTSKYERDEPVDEYDCYCEETTAESRPATEVEEGEQKLTTEVEGAVAMVRPLSLKQGLLVLGTAVRTRQKSQLEVALKLKQCDKFSFIFPEHELFMFYRHHRSIASADQVQDKIEQLEKLQAKRETERAQNNLARGLLGGHYFSTSDCESEGGKEEEEEEEEEEEGEQCSGGGGGGDAPAMTKSTDLDAVESIFATMEGDAIEVVSPAVCGWEAHREVSQRNKEQGQCGLWAQDKAATRANDKELRALRMKRAKALAGHFTLSMTRGLAQPEN